MPTEKVNHRFEDDAVLVRIEILRRDGVAHLDEGVLVQQESAEQGLPRLPDSAGDAFHAAHGETLDAGRGAGEGMGRGRRG